MKNIVLCFDRAGDRPGPRDATNAETLLRQLDEGDEQITWYHSGARIAAPSRSPLRWRRAAIDDARAAIAEAYEFLVDRWMPGDRIFVLGVGRGAYCGQALTRLLGTVGVLPQLMDYVLDAYALPRTRRTPQEWRQVMRLAAQLSGQRGIAIPVQFLGLWDTVEVPGLPRPTAPLTNVVSGRHAVAIDGGHGRLSEQLIDSASESVDEVWFRGAHCDVAGGPGTCLPLADIALDWVLDGAIKAGAVLRPASRDMGPAPTAVDALAGSARTISARRMPANALVHASVDIYLRSHPAYWRRLPPLVVWADVDWLARSERLVAAEQSAAPIEHAVLAAVAS